MEGAPIPQQQIFEESKEKAKYDMIFGVNQYANSMGMGFDDNPATAFQIDQAQKIMPNVAMDAFTDPLTDAGLF